MKYENLEIEDKNSKNLIITFGGIKEGIGMPVFEFYNSFVGLSCDKVFIKDVNQAWYHKGINKNVNDIFMIKNLLESIIKRKSYNKVLLIGNSMGGYAAILFGILLNVDNVIAFSPQTFLNRINRLRYRDKRWSVQISNVYLNNKDQKKFYDLKSFLMENKYDTNIDVYYSLNDKLDSKHSIRLKKQKRVNLFPIEKGNHNLIRVLRDEGKLLEIINKALH